jgi:hypothetical protein
MNPVPPVIIAEVASALADYLGSHSRIENFFTKCGAPLPAPGGNRVDKITAWLLAVNDDPSIDAQALLGCVLSEFMEREMDVRLFMDSRERLTRALARYGLSYGRGGLIMGRTVSAPARTQRSNRYIVDFESSKR